MKTTLCLFLALAALFPHLAWAQADGPSAKSASKSAPPKSQFNTSIYDKQNDAANFAAVVKVIRDVQEETQVFFDGQQGLFVLNMKNSKAGAWQNLLVQSQKKHSKVKVSYDPDSRQILDVSAAEDSEKNGK